MKISKVVTGLVVCGALIFPGALSSSAQEIDSSVSLETDNYSTKQETELLTYSTIHEAIALGKNYKVYQGPTVFETYTVSRPAPLAPAIYQGWLLYQYKDNNGYWYSGDVFLKN